MESKIQMSLKQIVKILGINVECIVECYDQFSEPFKS